MNKLSLAPMMDRTDRHFRYFLRLMSPDLLLYTEMVVAQAAVYGDRARLLGFAAVEAPVVLQLGGSDPELLGDAAVLGAERGYAAINLNIGCPSDRVQSGQFGACLMAEPERVAACVRRIRSRVDIPVTVKTRIGIDDRDDYPFLREFVEACAEAGCRTFVVHARKAILAGLSPAENRSIPPLNYERVQRLKADFSHLEIIVNGGIVTTAGVLEHLRHVDGVMIGRQAYKTPYWLTELQAAVFPERSWQAPSRRQVVEQMAHYADSALASGARMHHITRHMLGLFAGRPGARAWRRYVTEAAGARDATPALLLDSLERLEASETTA
ncbi:MAG: tRNA dihydrouridine(20/20a) synthase DusA [Gammaproteobacteria bacterium]|jgi:tRNA-dihydrouridine synthase A|nr:tRNA dihydrouridine(20/20a) synthase DusA [Gammaproteobacteria bacterium]